MADYLAERLEELIAEQNRTSDPNKRWEIDCEIENCMMQLEGV